jgi:oxygen-independent coproporphyrinogen-3 oxidase
MTRSDTPSHADGPTRGGTYFVSNYPPFSFWSTEAITDVEKRLTQRPNLSVPLGLYIHIPFCRKRCHFCYFKVYTQRSSKEVREYVDGLVEEMRLWSQEEILQERQADFIYFGGGTPSYLSVEILEELHASLQRHLPWAEGAEIAFECEPGTLSQPKLQAIREMGCTRLSLGVESFDEEILVRNGRAHRAKDIDEAYAMARDVGFPQINLDLIAGMVGETDHTWYTGVEKALAMEPESITIYQMELPFNTDLSRELREGNTLELADWQQKRQWVADAFQAFREAGYSQSSGYTMVHPRVTEAFRYRDALWHGADMLGIGVSSFSHVQGTHFQNEKSLETYLQRVAQGERPLSRGFALSNDERLIRELILQLKLGRIQIDYFQNKFGVDLHTRFATAFDSLTKDGFMTAQSGEWILSEEALLCVDTLLPRFYLAEHGASATSQAGGIR